MKKRSSLKKSEYSIDRAEWYREQCDEILYKKGIELQIDGQNVYTKANGEKIFLLEITNPKTIWFEIWLKLADR